MSLRDRFKNSRRLRARDVTVKGIGEFKVLIPSAAEVRDIGVQLSKIDPASELDMIHFMGTILVKAVVDENFERAYMDEEVSVLLEEVDPFALQQIFALILSKESPDETVKNSEPTPSADSPSA